MNITYLLVYVQMSTLFWEWRASCLAAEARQSVFPVPNGPYISKGGVTLLTSHLPRMKFRAICCLSFNSDSLDMFTGTQHLLKSGRTLCKSGRWSIAWCIWQNDSLSNWNWTSMLHLVSFLSCSSDTHCADRWRPMWPSPAACLSTNASYTWFLWSTDTLAFAGTQITKAICTPRLSISPSGESGVSKQDTFRVAKSFPAAVEICDVPSLNWLERDTLPQTLNLQVWKKKKTGWTINIYYICNSNIKKEEMSMHHMSSICQYKYVKS